MGITVEKEIEEEKSIRMKLLLSQYLAEGLAFDEKWEACLSNIQACLEYGLTDNNWLKFCPLFGPIQGHPIYLELKEELDKKLQPSLELSVA